MSRPNAERDYRDALAWTRAALDHDAEALRIIALYADHSGLVVALTGIVVDLLASSPGGASTVALVDDLFDQVDERMAAAEVRRQRRDGGGAS